MVRPPLLTWGALLLALVGLRQPFGLSADPRALPGLLNNHVRISYEEDSEKKNITGELVAERPGFGYLVLDSDGGLTAIDPKEFRSMDTLDTVLPITSATEMGQKLLALMPAGSQFIASEHFVVCFNTTETYARWNIDLYEKLYKSFHRFWKSKGVELVEPRFPLAALVFEKKADYVRYASQEFKGSENTFGYYHQGTNRLASYDLTGIEGMIPAGAKVNRVALISQILSRPEAERTVATIIHEACHQIAFNCGLQVRLGHNPLWLSEGLATFFETPDLRGGVAIGKINQHNYRNLLKYAPNRPGDSLTTLLLDDSRLRNSDTTANGYAEAWGLTHFLLQSKPKEFANYIRQLREIPIGVQPAGKERLDLFRDCFGQDINKLDREFAKHIQLMR